MSKIDERQNIVVVGGGGAGAPAVNALSAKLDPSKYNLVLITARPYYTHLIGCIRMLVTSEGRLEDRLLMPYDKNFVRGNGVLRVGKVVSIVDGGEKGGYVMLADGDRIDYSILVLAPGSIWEGPLAMPDPKSELVEWITKWRKDFEAATNVLIVGGGAVAIGL
jgi:apoptosis-inducing factor 2